MKIGIIQSNPVAGALRFNADRLLHLTTEAAAQGAELCLAPELSLCGHNVEDLLLRPDFAAACKNELEDLARRHGENASLPPLVLGAPVANPVPQGKPLQNCAVLLRNGKTFVLGRKVLLPCDGIDGDPRWFERGIACGVLHHKGWRFAVSVGEDAWNDRTFWKDRRTYDSDPVADFMAAGGADGLLNITAVPYAEGMQGLHQRMLGWSAAHYRVPVVAANCVGGNDSRIYPGGSAAFSGDGVMIARAPFFEEAVTVVDIGSGKTGAIAPDMSLDDEILAALILGTRDFVHKCGFSDVVVGLSGGIDSALVAAVAVEAFGPKHVHGLLMPSPYSSEGSVTDSLTLAKNLGISTCTVPISPMLEAYRTALTAALDGGFRGLAEENIQSRIRCSLLMAYAGSKNSLVLNTGNKSEAAVGYCTLYGDSGGALSVIGDLYKGRVYAVSRRINAVKGREIIPASILEKAPSAELRPDQKDTDSLPPYELLDEILFQHLENDCALEALLDLGFDRDTVIRVLGLVRGSEFTRRQPPPALALSRRPFGPSRRMPIVRSVLEVSR